jgi:mono/diheme cytochrome c family protein
MKRPPAILIRVLAILIALVAAALAGLYAAGAAKLRPHPERPIRALAIQSDSAKVARGRHIAEIVCASCHGRKGTLPLAGDGGNFGQIPNGPYLGELYASNLTPGGVLSRYGDGALARAIQEGVAVDGRVMLVMPSAQFRVMTDRDLEAVIAYLRSQPPAASAPHGRDLNALGHILLGAGVFETSLQPRRNEPPTEVTEDSTAAYGEYIVRLAACRDCHGKDLRGAPKSSLAPHGPDLVSLVAAHPESRFSFALRGGIGFDGRPLNPTEMPWTIYARLTDVETAAAYRYIRGLGGPAR